MDTLRSLVISAAFLIVGHASIGASNAIAEVGDSPATEPLTPFVAEYSAYRFGGEVGQASLTLEPLTTKQYSLTYSSKVSKFFLSDKRFEHSIFLLEDGQLVPSQYYYKRSGTGPDKALEVNFDHDKQQIKIDDQPPLPWNGQFDNQLFRIDVPRQLARGKTEMTYDFVNYRGEMREYNIQVVGTEQLELPYGMLDSIKIKINRGSSSRETFAWFSPSLDYVLVRLQQFKDGDEQGDIKLSAYRTTD
ncbi:DUF3108 domain-containing protein [Alteromonas sp. SM 2104]|nr:DUF3108 domain-containing protein [Alteromonas oceanisediminis]